MSRKTFIESERECETTFQLNGPWWHLFTDGKSTPIVLRTEDDYNFTMNLMARCCYRYGSLNVVAFELMSNHIHIIISGQEHEIEDYFMYFRARLKRYLSGHGIRLTNGFQMQTKAIHDLKSLRNSIVYTNRNGYVVTPEHTPFSYKWGTGRYYFNHFPILQTLNQFNKRAKQVMFRSRLPKLPQDSLVIEGHIAPPSYCALRLGMSIFRDAHQYFSMVSKNVEAYCEIAAELDDNEFLTDTELFTITGKTIREKYMVASVKELNKAQKLDLIRTLHYEYHSSNGQISRLLGISQYDVDSLFPLSKH